MRNRWIQFLLCLLLSASVWLIHNMSRTYVNLVSVPVVAESNIEGRAGVSSTDATVTAQVRTTGYRQASLRRKHKRPVTIRFDAEDFRHEDGNLYSVQTANLYKYTSQLFGDGVSVESFVSGAPKFVFQQESFRKVPVRKVLDLSFEPQYMARRQMEVSPDSVLVYGEPSRIESIEYVPTRPIDLWELNRSVHGTVKLETPSGVRLSESEVSYSLDVTRYVEVSADVEIETRNVPHGTELMVLPSTARVVFRCSFPIGTNPASRTKFYVDFNDFSGSITGRCVAHDENLPSGVIDYSITPDVFDCIMVRSER